MVYTISLYNFFIKKISSLHPVLYEVIKTICLSSQEEDTWFYKGLTYLIPKGTPTRGSDLYVQFVQVGN